MVGTDARRAGVVNEPIQGRAGDWADVVRARSGRRVGLGVQ